MHIDEVRRMQAEKDHMMKHEMTHPVNNPKQPFHEGLSGVDYNSHGVELQ